MLSELMQNYSMQSCTCFWELSSFPGIRSFFKVVEESLQPLPATDYVIFSSGEHSLLKLQTISALFQEVYKHSGIYAMKILDFLTIVIISACLINHIVFDSRLDL